jgi:hypothetical protein
MNRADFLRQVGGFVAVALMQPRGLAALAVPPSPTHPDPRPGITSERVLTAEALGSARDKVLAAYDGARAYPEIFDGLTCACGCDVVGHRSLLVCYETMQPTGCRSCQDEATLVTKLAKTDKTLAEIRRAVDKQS